MDDLKEIKQDLKELNTAVTRLSVGLEHYNTLLAEHIRRTAMLEDRMMHVERHIDKVEVIGKVIRGTMGSGGVIGIVWTILKLLKVI